MAKINKESYKRRKGAKKKRYHNPNRVVPNVLDVSSDRVPVDEDGIIRHHFQEINLAHIKAKYNFHKIDLLGERIHIITKSLDEWFIEKEVHIQCEHEVLVLHHRNYNGAYDRFHREDFKFENVFCIFGYIRSHENKFNNAPSKMYNRVDKMSRLFEKIASKQ